MLFKGGSKIMINLEIPVNGKFGEYGGNFVPETLMYALKELENAFLRYRNDPDFVEEVKQLLQEYWEDRHLCIMQRD